MEQLVPTFGMYLYVAESVEDVINCSVKLEHNPNQSYAKLPN